MDKRYNRCRRGCLLASKILTEYLSEFVKLTDHVNDVEILVTKDDGKKEDHGDHHRRAGSVGTLL